jgi:hypothetical protein
MSRPAPSADAGDERKVPTEDSRSDRWSLLALLIFCAAIIALRWSKMESLYNTDPVMWLSQIGRFARGEMPYRDFGYLYPPLTIFLFGWVAQLFGATFNVIQAFMDLICLVIVLLFWWLARRLLSPSTRLVSVAAVVAIGATTLTKFNLFSFSTYSPSLELAAVGLLLLMTGGVRQLKRGSAGKLDFGLIACGTFIATITKPEAMLAAWAALVLLFALDRSRRIGWYAAIFALTGLASAAVYGAVGSVVGFQHLRAGVSGYGLASFSCPWWPTGFGAFGAVAAIGEAVFAAALLLWPVRRQLTPSLQRQSREVWIAGIIGFLIFAAYVWYQCGDVLLSGASRSLKLEALGRVTIWTSPALLPVMWVSICVCLRQIVTWRRLSLPSRMMCFVLSVPVVMSSRSLFGTTLFPYTEVSALCYPFFVFAAAYLIESLYSRALVRSSAASASAITVLLGGYSLLRLVVAYPAQLSNTGYYSLRTNAGTVRLSDDHISEQIYSYVLNHANQTDALLDLPYGGGFNFATQLPSPVFTTMFVDLFTPPKYQQQDLDRIRRTPPVLVIADRGAHFGSEFGYPGNMRCAFPRLVWQPDRPSWDPGYVFPVVSYLEQHYRVLTTIGPKLILAPESGLH